MQAHWLQGVHPPRGGFNLQSGKEDFLLLTCNTMPPPKHGKMVSLLCGFGLTQMGKASYITYLEGRKPDLLCSSCYPGKKDQDRSSIRRERKHEGIPLLVSRCSCYQCLALCFYTFSFLYLECKLTCHTSHLRRCY